VVEVHARERPPLRRELTPASVPVRTFNSQEDRIQKVRATPGRLFNIGVVRKHKHDLENAK
jgi:hypothetical protein